MSGVSIQSGGWQVFIRVRTVRVGRGRIVGSQDGRMARMLEDAKVERLPMRLNAPGDRVTRFNINPTNKVGLQRRKKKDDHIHRLVEGSASTSFSSYAPYLAVDLQLLHSRHDCAKKANGPGRQLLRQ